MIPFTPSLFVFWSQFLLKAVKRVVWIKSEAETHFLLVVLQQRESAEALGILWAGRRRKGMSGLPIGGPPCPFQAADCSAHLSSILWGSVDIPPGALSEDHLQQLLSFSVLTYIFHLQADLDVHWDSAHYLPPQFYSVLKVYTSFGIICAHGIPLYQSELLKDRETPCLPCHFHKRNLLRRRGGWKQNACPVCTRSCA